jgi:hypothetical protein
MYYFKIKDKIDIGQSIKMMRTLLGKVFLYGFMVIKRQVFLGSRK